MRRVCVLFVLGCAAGVNPASAQDHSQHQMSEQSSGWRLMQDGVVFGLFNHQGGPRGGDEVVVPNWWMGMWTRDRGPSQFGINAMFSLDAASVGKDGYRELFQVGEALDGRPLIDRQHPHDLFMQIAASWRQSIGKSTFLTLAGGPSGEPTLGPVAFIHRPSAAGLVMAPLGHHTFDSTHVSFGVVTASLERGRFTVEGSAFNGREPDEDRWDFDFGALDSFAGRLWFRPAQNWELQVSSGKLREPEQLVAGDVIRTTTSIAYFRTNERGFKAFTGGYGVNAAHGEQRHGVFGEFTMERNANSVFGRVEWQQTETDVLITGEVPDHDHAADSSPVSAFTIGAARSVVSWRGFDGALGTHMVFYRVPDALKETHGDPPVSFQFYFRLRLPSTGPSRMWNMRMSQGHRMEMGNHR